MYQVQNRIKNSYLMEFHIICYKKAQLTFNYRKEINIKFLPKFLTLQKCEEIKKSYIIIHRMAKQNCHTCKTH